MKDITTEEAVNELKERIQTLKRHIKNYEESKCETNIYNQLKKESKAIEKVLNELEKKDRIIDAMAKFIDTELSSEHLTKVLKKEVLPLKTYREDIKQYFEKEVKDE